MFTCGGCGCAPGPWDPAEGVPAFQQPPEAPPRRRQRCATLTRGAEERGGVELPGASVPARAACGVGRGCGAGEVSRRPGGPQVLVQGLGWVHGWGSHIYSWGTWRRAPVLTAAPSRPLTAWGAETLLGPHCAQPRGCACAGGVRTPVVGGSASRLPWGCVCRFPQRHGGQRRGPGRGHQPPGARGHSPGARAPEPFQSR